MALHERWSQQTSVLAACSAGLVLTHVLIDQHIGLWGASSEQMSVLQAAHVGTKGLLFGWWVLMLAWARSPARPGAPLALLLLVLIKGFLSEGLVALFACPPPCAGAFPYQDVVHVANLVVGGLASWAAYRSWKQASDASRWLLPVVTIAIIVLGSAISGTLALETLGS